MDEEFEAGFFGVQNLAQYCRNGKVQDMPLSNEFLDGFYLESYQASAPGGLPSPNFSNPDLPASGRQSPFLPSLSPFTSGYEFSQMDGSSGANNDFLHLPLLQPLQESGTSTSSNTSNKKPNTNQTLSDASNSFSETHEQLGEPSVISSNHINMRQSPSFMIPSDRSLCNSYQSNACPVPSESSVEQGAPIWPMSTNIPIAPKVVDNTSLASAPANQQHSPTSKAQHFVRHSSRLRHQIHPELSQYSPLTATATEGYSTGQPPLTMSSGPNFTNRQESPLYSNHQNVRHAPHKPQFRGTTSAYNQSRGSPVLQNYQPFQESSLRSPVTSALEQNAWEAEQLQVPQYPELQPTIQQQPDRSSYLGQHSISQPQGNSMDSYSSAQYLIQSSDSRNASFISQGSSEVDFNGSSPKSIKREMSPPDSDRSASTPTTRSPPKSQRKRRAKRELKNKEDNEAVVNPAALQTADLTNLDPTDQTNVAALIDAMHNTVNVEDNQGMQKTWEKVRRAKAFRIKEVSVELLDLTKQAQQKKGTPLGEKKAINHYASFQKRFDALRATLMYQKTVCKHLIEPPYSYSVVDDPQNATDRVKNNRRVNHQKAEAIRLGREHLGEKGQGKGKPMLKTKKRVQAQMEDSEDDEENSGDDVLGDDALSDAETEVLPRLLGPKSGCPGPRTHKRTKRASRLRYQPGNVAVTDTSLSQSSNSTPRLEHRDTIQASYSPQSQRWEDPFAFAHILHQNAQSPDQQWQMPSDHVHGLPEHVANQQMPTLNQDYPFHSAKGSGTNSYGYNSTAGSDNEGHGAIGCEYK